jgi:dTDP-glucose 4,6-dehydratase
LVETLLAAGAQVRAFVRYTSRRDPGLLKLLRQNHLSRCEFIFGDLRDAEAVEQACRGVDTVFHLGAIISVPYSCINPREVVETNVIGTLNLLLASQRHAVKKVVYTSTSEIYGTALYTPINEQHPLQAQSPYSASKIGAEKLAQSFHYSYGLPVAVIRPFNTYGPRQSSRAVIPSIITQALTQDEVRLGNLAPRRDFTFITDTVDAFLRIGAAAQTVGQEINIGSGLEISVEDLANKIIGVIGRDVPITCEKQRVRSAGEVERLQADARKAGEMVGWQPRVSLTQGLIQTIDWVNAHQHFYNAGDYQV